MAASTASPGRGFASGKRSARTSRWRGPLLAVGLAVFAAWSLFPFFWIVTTALKPNRDIYRRVTLWPSAPTLEHFAEVLRETPFLTYFRNSLFVALSTTVLAMAIALLAAYALTRLSFRGRTTLARATIVTYLVPASLLFIPLFQVAFQLNLTDKAAGLIVVYLIFTVPFATWLAISTSTPSRPIWRTRRWSTAPPGSRRSGRCSSRWPCRRWPSSPSTPSPSPGTSSSLPCC
jgi:multiple sugar transport system permease protein